MYGLGVVRVWSSSFPSTVAGACTTASARSLLTLQNYFGQTSGRKDQKSGQIGGKNIMMVQGLGVGNWGQGFRVSTFRAELGSIQRRFMTQTGGSGG